MKIVKEFNYGIRPLKMLLPMLMFGACAAFFFREALTNDRGLIINGIFRMDAGQGTIFYYVMAGLSAMFVIGAAAGMISGLSAKKKLVIFSDGLEIPIRKEKVRLYFSNIASVQMLDIYKTRIIELVTKENRKYSILDSALGTKAEMDEVFKLISDGTGGNT
jgi:hypothetical protein